MNKKMEVTEKTRNAFIKVFCELYKQKPIEKITVQEITRMAGYNRSTFYQYFTDIYDLLEYLEQDVLDHLRQSPRPNPQNGLDDMFVQRIARLYEEKDAYLDALLGDYGNVRFSETIKREMKRAIIEEQVIPEDDALIPYILESCLSMAFGAFRFWQHNGKNISSEALITLIRNLLTQGVLPQVQHLS
ncbi:MAG: TetR/AcrR family transcriptional regulator [Clostridiales bacterium]|nr:TetR/AcrR family transcriptional regulator [Clostridiales bacterium]